MSKQKQRSELLVTKQKTSTQFHKQLTVKDVYNFCKTKSGINFVKKRTNINGFEFQIHLYANGITDITNGFVQFFVELIKIPSPVKAIVVFVNLFCVETNTKHTQTKLFQDIGDSEGWVWSLTNQQCMKYDKLQFCVDMELLQIRLIQHNDNKIDDIIQLPNDFKIPSFTHLVWKWNDIKHILNAIKNDRNSTRNKLFFSENANIFVFAIESQSKKDISVSCYLLKLPSNIEEITVLFNFKFGLPEYPNTFRFSYECRVAKIKLLPMDCKWILCTNYDANFQFSVKIKEIQTRSNHRLHNIVRDDMIIETRNRTISDTKKKTSIQNNQPIKAKADNISINEPADIHNNSQSVNEFNVTPTITDNNTNEKDCDNKINIKNHENEATDMEQIINAKNRNININANKIDNKLYKQTNEGLNGEPITTDKIVLILQENKCAIFKGLIRDNINKAQIIEGICEQDWNDKEMNMHNFVENISSHLRNGAIKKKLKLLYFRVCHRISECQKEQIIFEHKSHAQKDDINEHMDYIESPSNNEISLPRGDTMSDLKERPGVGDKSGMNCSIYILCSNCICVILFILIAVIIPNYNTQYDDDDDGFCYFVRQSISTTV